MKRLPRGRNVILCQSREKAQTPCRNDRAIWEIRDQVVRGRNRAALRQLLGENYRRVLTSDRHKVYDHLAE
jgi:hypothetical protein